MAAVRSGCEIHLVLAMVITELLVGFLRLVVLVDLGCSYLLIICCSYGGWINFFW